MTKKEVSNTHSKLVPIVAMILYMSAFNTVLHAQNLVRNPSFETFSTCPKEKGNISSDVKHWYVATKGTTDYFNECSGLLGVPRNFNGVQASDFGKGYAGLYLLGPNNYREYLQGTLSKTLLPGKKYRLSFYLNLADKSAKAIGEIGILFSSNRIAIPTLKVLKNPWENQRENTISMFYVKAKPYFSDKNNWMYVETEFEALGTENHFTIGNFKTDEKTVKKNLKSGKPAAYYYIDMVSVVPADANPLYDPLQLDRTYVFEHILFKSDAYELVPKAKEELDALYEQLKKDQTLTLTIDAHTDTDGSAKYNEKLSQKRAKAVANYLMDKGLPLHRIFWNGHGGNKPLAENNTAGGKQKNRRVEFQVTKAKDNIANTVFEDDNN